MAGSSAAAAPAKIARLSISHRTTDRYRHLVTLGAHRARSTQAWAGIYLPGAGWIALDPTNRTIGEFGLIPVAVAPDIEQAVPVSGSFVGAPGDDLGMTVEVAVRLLNP